MGIKWMYEAVGSKQSPKGKGGGNQYGAKKLEEPHPRTVGAKTYFNMFGGDDPLNLEGAVMNVPIRYTFKYSDSGEKRYDIRLKKDQKMSYDITVMRHLGSGPVIDIEVGSNGDFWFGVKEELIDFFKKLTHDNQGRYKLALLAIKHEKDKKVPDKNDMVLFFLESMRQAMAPVSLANNQIGEQDCLGTFVGGGGTEPQSKIAEIYLVYVGGDPRVYNPRATDIIDQNNKSKLNRNVKRPVSSYAEKDQIRNRKRMK